MDDAWVKIFSLVASAGFAYAFFFRPLLSHHRKRWLLAGVAAELKAQCKSQDLVKQVCFTPMGGTIIRDLARTRFPHKGRLRYFMITTFLLAETLRLHDVPLHIKTLCVSLLQQRRRQIQDQIINNRHSVFKMPEQDVDDLLDNLDDIAEVGMQMMNDEVDRGAADTRDR